MIIERLKLAAVKAQEDAIKMVMGEAERFVSRTVHSASMMLQFELKMALATLNRLKDDIKARDAKVAEVCRQYAKQERKLAEYAAKYAAVGIETEMTDAEAGRLMALAGDDGVHEPMAKRLDRLLMD